MNRELWETWRNFMDQALKGSEEARREFDRLTKGAYGPEAISLWARTWFPQASRTELEEVLERWWRILDVVPRQRYLEALEQNELLRRRLAESEHAAERLRAKLSQAGVPEDIRSTLDEWEETTRRVLDAQTELTRKWTAEIFGKKPEEDG
jgi:hypothetical protein